MPKISFKKLRRLLPGIKRNILLRDYTTFKIGGRARYFLKVKTSVSLIRATSIAKKNKLPFFILGKGSNLLVSDKGFKGLIIKIENQNLEIKSNTVICDAGTPLPLLVNKTAKAGLSGLEWAAGIPGTLGGAIRGNAGAFGSETKNLIYEVRILDEKDNLRKISNKKCNFSYRSSVFKKKKWIILSAILRLKKKNKKNIQSLVRNYIKYRKEKQPLNYPSAGSVFKNVDFKEIPKNKRESFSKIVKKDPFPIIPVAYFLSEANLKGLRIGGAEVSKKHPNFIVNSKKARAGDVKKLISLIKKRIKKKFGINLEEEIQYLGF